MQIRAREFDALVKGAAIVQRIDLLKLGPQDTLPFRYLAKKTTAVFQKEFASAAEFIPQFGQVRRCDKIDLALRKKQLQVIRGIGVFRCERFRQSSVPWVQVSERLGIGKKDIDI